MTTANSHIVAKIIAYALKAQMLQASRNEHLRQAQLDLDAYNAICQLVADKAGELNDYDI